jgi:phosphoglucomutase
MDLLTQAREGFNQVEVAAATREQALQFLGHWLTDADFVPYRPQLEWLIQQKKWSGLLDRFYQILPFGTGGRRGAVGIGPNRMNLWTLGASVQGHCEYLKEKFPGVAPLKVVLAYDVRQFEDKNKNYHPSLPNPVLHLSSKEFARQAAGIYVANSIHAHILPDSSNRFLATPELSFLIRLLGAHGGLNISASHNPPDDNGGKFYDERGGQPVPPDDQIMADLVDQVKTIKTQPWSESQRSGKIHAIEETGHQAYIDLIGKQSLVPAPKFDEIQVVFTPLHGVGHITAMEALVKQGFRVKGVEEQMTPNGQFPNVTKTPNPEVPESMDKAEALARSIKADLVLSTDPDADRLGAMIPGVRGQESGAWRFVTGNEIVALLTHFKLSKLSEQGRLPESPIVVKTGVTTSLVTRIARQFGCQVVEDLLVGFKYIAEVLWQLESAGSYEEVRGRPADFIIGCEESHGVLVTPAIRDKDAAGGALLLAELALDQKRQGKTVLGYLGDLYRRFGYFHNSVAGLAMSGIEGKQQMGKMLDLLRKSPPKEIAGLKVTGFEDLRDENGRFGPLKGATDAASRNVLVFKLGDRAKVTLRPSGTEPKAKAYVEVGSAPCPAGASAEAWAKTCKDVDEQAKKLAKEFVTMALGLVGIKAP